MATNVAHEKPESEDQPTVKKLRIDEDAASVESASTTEDRAESVDASAEDSAEEKDLESGTNGSSATVSTPKAAPASSGFGGFSGFSGFSSYSGGGGFSGFAKTAESTTSTAPSSTSSGFGTFATTAESSSSSGFSGFAMSAEASSGFGAFAKADDASEGFGEAATADFDPNAEENTAEFTPVVTLTEAETVNGEEEERLIVEKRAKLFKLIGTDYVEVGVGPFRLLQPKDAREIEQVRASARIVMRRESYPRGPGTKLILNARLTACVSCVKKSEKSLMVVVVEAPTSEGKDQEATAAADQDNKIKPVTYLLRFASQDDLLLVQDRVVDLLPARASTS